MATTRLPESIEQPLLALDRQVRDAVFTRGLARLTLVIAVGLALALASDGWLCLSGPVRGGMLAIWTGVCALVAWHQVLRPMFRPLSLAELAAIVESQHPELKERLISLVEFRTTGAAPGASRLMRELMAKQTVKAVEQLDLSEAAPANRSPRMSFAAVVACFLLFAPFLSDSHGYGLLWARFFAPWGNFNWGSLELLVPDGDQVVAKGSDVPIRIEAHRRAKSAAPLDQTVVWLHWTEAGGATDTRRLEWDADANCFATTLPHVFHGFQFHATTRGARSRTHRIHVADPPSIARLHLDISPPAYTGLPARTLDGAQGEVRAAERSRIQMQFEFNEPVSFAELTWPALSDAAQGTPTETPISPQHLPLKLSADKRSAIVETLAVTSGPFAIRLKNVLGLTNDDPTRTLAVDPDLPPAISLTGNEEPVAVKPDDRYLVKADIHDDYGLTAVELHLETSTGHKRTDTLPAEMLRERRLSHEFPIDLADLALTPGQAVTYRLRAVDNRPLPQPQESWTKPRTLMIQSQVTPMPEQQVAEQQQEVDEQLADIRDDLAKAKEALQELHAQTEKESLQQKNTNKSEQLEQLEQQQAEIVERVQQLAAELAENRLTEKLSQNAANVAERDLAEAMRKLDEAKETAEPRDQLAPISQSIDRLAAADRQLQTLERQLNELQRLEQDLAELDRIANKTDRLAEQLEQLDRQQREAATQQANADMPPNDATKNEATKGDAPGEPQPNEAVANSERQQQLQADGQKLAQELNDLLQKHPELLDAARQDQRQKLEQLAEQAQDLAQPQQQLAAAFQQEAENAPASAMKPTNQEEGENGKQGEGETKTEPDNGGKQPMADQPKADSSPASEPKPAPDKADSKRAEPTPAEAAGAQAVRQQQRLAQEATRQALELAREQGAESEATQAATEFAKQATAAARQAQIGQLDQAADQAQAAADAAEQAAKQLAPEGQPSNPQSEQASKLAQQQQQLAEQLEQLASSEEGQRGAQQQGQQQLAQATKALSQRLEQAAENLASSPLDEQSTSDAASRAQQAASAARQSMQRAAEALQADDATGAAEQAARAAEQLQQAGREAQSGQDPSKSNSLVPEEVAAQVADAARQLQQAQQALTQPAKDSPTGESASPAPSGEKSASPEGTRSDQPGENPANRQGEANSPSKPSAKQGRGGGTGSTEPQSPAGTKSESSLAQTAEQFRRAAEAMRSALHGDGDATATNEPGQPNGKNKPSRAAQTQANAEADPNQEPGEMPGLGGGGLENVDLGQLNSELKKQAQRNWGKLPGSLRTEILQGASKKPHPEYAKQIKSYFEEIAKPAAKESGK